MEGVVLQRSVVLMRVVRYFAVFGAIVVISAAVLISGCEYGNSRNIPFPSDAELRASVSRASAWVFNNREQLLSEDNAMLWLFVREAGKASGEDRLSVLASEYVSKHPDSWIWHSIFNSDGRERTAGQHIAVPDYIPDYNRLLIYGATCNDSVREDPAVVALLSASGCGSLLAGLRAPWCRTHQLMGLRLVQKNHCEPDDVTTQTVASVQSLIIAEESWDFRVEDSYIQRVLMLVESGRRQDVRAIWLKKIVDAQRADGGWDGVDVIAQLPGNRVLCWAGRPLPSIVARRSSNLHATAQALYLLALWLGG